MKLCFPYFTVWQPYVCKTFPLPPAAVSVHFVEPPKIADRVADCERLNVTKFADQIETHARYFGL